MISSMRKAAAVLQSAATSSGHSHINMAIYHEKCVAQVMNKLTDTKAQACKALLEWASHEENPMINGLYQKLSEIDQLWLHLHQQYAMQYNNSRRSYKPILRGEKQLDELRKHCESQQSKVAKIRKQTENMTKTSKKAEKKSEKKDVQMQRMESQQLEFGKAVSLEEKSIADFNKAKENHTLFKYAKIQEALLCMNKASRTFHESCLRLEDAREMLFQVFLSSSSSICTAEAASRARATASDIIRNLANELSLPHPQVLAENASFQMSDVFMKEFNLLHQMPIGLPASNSTLTKGLDSPSEGAYVHKLEKDLLYEGSNTYMPLPQKEINDAQQFKGCPALPTASRPIDKDDDSSSSEEYQCPEVFLYPPRPAVNGGRARERTTPGPATGGPGSRSPARLPPSPAGDQTSSRSPGRSPARLPPSPAGDQTGSRPPSQSPGRFPAWYETGSRPPSRPRPRPPGGSRPPSRSPGRTARPTSDDSSDESGEPDYFNMTLQRRHYVNDDYDIAEKVVIPPSIKLSGSEDRRPPPIPVELAPAPPLPTRSASLVQPLQAMPPAEQSQGHLTPLSHSYTVASSSPRILRRQAAIDEVSTPGPPVLPARMIGTSAAVSGTDAAPIEIAPKPPVLETKRPIPAVRKHVKQVRHKALPRLPTDEPYHGTVPVPKDVSAPQDTGPQDYMTMDQIANLPSSIAITEPDERKS